MIAILALAASMMPPPNATRAHTLVTLCKASNPACNGYLRAVADSGHITGDGHYVKMPFDVQLEALKANFLSFMADHPEMSDKSAYQAAWFAMVSKWGLQAIE